MRAQFVCERTLRASSDRADVHFEEGPLMGARLVGFWLWKSPDAIRTTCSEVRIPECELGYAASIILSC
jgi:hypothetical protein